MGAYVSLLEYNGIEGMILLSELSRRRIRSITKLIKVLPHCHTVILVTSNSTAPGAPLQQLFCAAAVPAPEDAAAALKQQRQQEQRH